MTNLLLSLLVVAVVGCKGKSAPPAPAPVAGSGSGSAAATHDMVAIKNEPPIAIAGAPAECEAYKAAIEKLATCTSLDVATRAKLRHAYNESAAKWNAAGSADKAGLAQQCKDGLTALEGEAKAPCKW